jgi:hypothetical protein
MLRQNGQITVLEELGPRAAVSVPPSSYELARPSAAFVVREPPIASIT